MLNCLNMMPVPVVTGDQGGGGTGIPNQGWGPAKGRKKKVTPQFGWQKSIADGHEGTSDGSASFELL